MDYKKFGGFFEKFSAKWNFQGEFIERIRLIKNNII
jgi:hypothetical protein